MTGLRSVDRAGEPGRRGRSLRPAVAMVLFTAPLAVVVLPDLLFGLDRRSPFAQVIAFRPVLLVGVVGLVLSLAVVTAFRRGAWPLLAGAAAVLATAGSLVLPRAVADPLPAPGPSLAVLSFNTFDGAADVGSVANLVRDIRPDVLSLPESGERYRSRLAPLLEPLGYRLVSSSDDPSEPDVQNVVAGYRSDLGGVRTRLGQGYGFPYVELTGGALGSLRFVAYHAVAPVPDLVPGWRDDLARLGTWCAGPGPVVVAGDLNATLDHSALREGMTGCSDAADQRGQGLVPTWGPRLVGPQIDHVLGSAGIEATDFAVADVPGSDHRAIIARLRLPDGTDG